MADAIDLIIDLFSDRKKLHQHTVFPDDPPKQVESKPVEPNLSRGQIPPPFEYKLLVPGTKYTGPGNPLDNGKPTNLADADARHHDHQYHVAETPEQIKESDSQLVSKGLDHVAETISGKGHLGDGLVGGIQAGGISLKRLYENTFNKGKIVYPSKVNSEYAYCTS